MSRLTWGLHSVATANGTSHLTSKPPCSLATATIIVLIEEVQAPIQTLDGQVVSGGQRLRVRTAKGIPEGMLWW